MDESITHNRKPSERALSVAHDMLGKCSDHRLGDSQVVDGFWIETHTLGCRDAADEPQDQWADSHESIYQEYDQDGMSVIIGYAPDPFVTLTPQRVS